MMLSICAPGGALKPWKGDGRMARPEKCRRICSRPGVRAFVPADCPPEGEVILGFDEYEAVRLIDALGYTQDACARKMGVSRSTVARIYAAARRTLADALIHGRALRIEGGDVIVCAKFREECAGVEGCCHRAEPQTNLQINRMGEEI